MSNKTSKKNAMALVEAGLMTEDQYREGIEKGVIAGNGGAGAGEYTDNQQDCLSQLGKVLNKFSGQEKTATAMHLIDKCLFKITVYREGTQTYNRAMHITEEPAEVSDES